MRKIYSIIACIIVLAACKTTTNSTKETKSPQVVCNKMLVTYNTHIKQVIDENCANTCHSEKKHAHGIDLSTYEKVKAASANPNFLGSINHAAGFDAMPINKAKLDEATINKITCWIQNGTAN